jgi:hypothetical protein
MREQGGIGRDHDDDGPHRRPASVLGRQRDQGLVDVLTHGGPVDSKAGPATVIRLDKDPHGVAPGGGRDDARRGSDSAFELVADHAGAASHVAFGDGARGRGRERVLEVFGAHVHAAYVVQRPVPRLAHHRESGGEAGGRKRVSHDADAVGVGDRDRRREQARFPEPFQSGELAVAVQSLAPGEHGVAARICSSRQYHGDSGANRSSLDDRGVTDGDARHVRDGIVGTTWQTADGDPQLACSNHVPRIR